jgi:hypothetical protein
MHITPFAILSGWDDAIAQDYSALNLRWKFTP